MLGGAGLASDLGGRWTYSCSHLTTTLASFEGGASRPDHLDEGSGVGITDITTIDRRVLLLTSRYWHCHVVDGDFRGPDRQLALGLVCPVEVILGWALDATLDHTTALKRSLGFIANATAAANSRYCSRDGRTRLNFAFESR